MSTHESGIIFLTIHLYLKDLTDLNPIQIKYSKYAVSLDKIFKHSSLQGLQYQLKNPRIFRTKEFNLPQKEKTNHDIMYVKIYKFLVRKG